MTLGRERAIATAFLLSGDEDIREGVIAAQDMGVRVVVLGIPPVGGSGTTANQASTLIREADGHVVMDQSFWQPHFAPVGEPPEKPQIPPTRRTSRLRERPERASALAGREELHRTNCLSCWAKVHAYHAKLTLSS